MYFCSCHPFISLIQNCILLWYFLMTWNINDFKIQQKQALKDSLGIHSYEEVLTFELFCVCWGSSFLLSMKFEWIYSVPGFSEVLLWGTEVTDYILLNNTTWSRILKRVSSKLSGKEWWWRCVKFSERWRHFSKGMPCCCFFLC